MYTTMAHTPRLSPYAADMDLRVSPCREIGAYPLSENGCLRGFAEAQTYYGIHRVDGGWVYREWAPGACRLYLTGEFNAWDWKEHPMLPLGNGSWVLYVPGKDTLWEGCKVRTVVEADFQRTAHIPLYICQTEQASNSILLCAGMEDSRREYPWVIRLEEHQAGAARHTDREKKQAI